MDELTCFQARDWEEDAVAPLAHQDRAEHEVCSLGLHHNLAGLKLDPRDDGIVEPNLQPAFAQPDALDRKGALRGWREAM